MGEPTSVERVYEECREQLRGLQPGIAVKKAVRVRGMGPIFDQLSNPAFLSLMTWTVLGEALLHAEPGVTETLGPLPRIALHEMKTTLREASLGMGHAKELVQRPEIVRAADEVRAFLGKAVEALRGRAGQSWLTRAMPAASAVLEGIGLSEASADEGAERVIQTLVKHLGGPPAP